MYIKDKDGNYVPTPSSKGADGREVSLRVANNYIQWRYPDTEWTNLVPLSDLKGEPGTDGIDGREVHMRVVSDTLQWRLGDSGTWQTLMSLSTVTDGAAFGGMVVDKTLVLAEMEAGDADISLGLTAATPGQIIKVKTVQDGKPTEWEAVDMAGGEGKWNIVHEQTITEDIEAFSYDITGVQAAAIIVAPNASVAGGWKRFILNGKQIPFSNGAVQEPCGVAIVIDLKALIKVQAFVDVTVKNLETYGIIGAIRSALTAGGISEITNIGIGTKELLPVGAKVTIYTKGGEL